jgi:glycosyltransferase involved in cell wall biosynthesis
MATQGDGLWVGVVANLRSVKRLDLFVGALARVAATSATGGFRGIVIGEGPERARLESQARQFGVEDRLVLVGASDDPRAYLQHLDLFVLCSDREGLSNAVIEAMSCGLPIVATDVGGNPELVDASNGVLVRPGDVDDLSAAIARLLDDPERRRSMGRASRSRVERDFSWDETLRQLEGIYRGLIGTAPSSQPAEVRS